MTEAHRSPDERSDIRELTRRRPRISRSLIRATDSILKQPNNFRYDSAFPRRDASELCLNLSPNRGRGECRVPAAPAASCAMVVVAHEVSHHGRTGTPGIPARNGFNGFLRALPGD